MSMSYLHFLTNFHGFVDILAWTINNDLTGKDGLAKNLNPHFKIYS